jgi:hypothetical protein
VTFCAIAIRNGQAQSKLDLNKDLGDPVRTFVAKSLPKRSGYSKKELNVSFSDVHQVRDNEFSAHVETVIGKQCSSDAAEVSFRVAISSGRLTLKMLGIAAAR